MRLVVVAVFALNILTARGQIFSQDNAPRGYFRNPLNIPISLAGNFGELRPNHYHMGWDLKTEHRENLPVHAAADGYIARVKIEPAGFGKAIYINHPNGFTTVYAHLNAFMPALEAWVKQQQYRLQSWKVFLDLPPTLFPVKKGDQIANSGNTGGSQGPHLHFEIRGTADDINRNPALFGFPPADNTRPLIQRLAVYDRRISVYEQSPRYIPIRKTTNGYITASPLILLASPLVSFAISASDTHTGSSGAHGIFEAAIYDNDRPLTAFRMDHISYDNTRNINAHIDYKTQAGGGPYLQQLFELPGYSPSIYKKINGSGIIDIGDGAEHLIRITVKDAYDNTATLLARIKFSGLMAALPAVSGKLFYPRMLDGFESENCEFFIGEKCLYDTVHIVYASQPNTRVDAVSAVHSIGASYIPLQDYMLIRIKPLQPLDTAKRNRVVMQWSAGSKQGVQKVEWQKGWAAARFRDMGHFQLLLDESPPAIIPVGFSSGANLHAARRIVFIIKDNLEIFKNFRAELDGKWLCFTNDKGKSFSYIFDEQCGPGPHTLRISVEDEAGNTAVKLFRFTR